MRVSVDIQGLVRFQNAVSPVVSVAAVRTVDDMIAAGTRDGTITIFQLPRVTNIPPTHSSVASSKLPLQQYPLSTWMYLYPHVLHFSGKFYISIPV